MEVKSWNCVIKVGQNSQNKDFVTWHSVNDLLRMVRALDKLYPDWRYFNVLDKRTGTQIANFTKHKRPISKYPI